MKVVVIGGTGLIGSKAVRLIRGRGHEAVAASPDTGVDTITGAGLDEVLEGAGAVLDVSNTRTFDEATAVEFFETSTSNLLAAGAAAGVHHHVALSVVGTERLGASGYFRGKAAQEHLITESGLPYSIVHATQFFEFVSAIADEAGAGGTVRVPAALIQPMAANDVAAAVAEVTVGAALNRIVEVGGPEAFPFDEFVRRGLTARHDSRPVVADPHARYFGYQLAECTLIPGPDARLGETRFDDWLSSAVPA